MPTNEEISEAYWLSRGLASRGLATSVDTGSGELPSLAELVLKGEDALEVRPVRDEIGCWGVYCGDLEIWRSGPFSKLSDAEAVMYLVERWRGEVRLREKATEE